MLLFNRKIQLNMQKNYNNNNIFDLVPINCKSFSLLQLEAILYYYCLFNNYSPYKINILDCNKNPINCSKELKLYFNTSTDIDHPDYHISANVLRYDIIRACNEWANKFAHSLPNPNLYYLEIMD